MAASPGWDSEQQKGWIPSQLSICHCCLLPGKGAVLPAGRWRCVHSSAHRELHLTAAGGDRSPKPQDVAVCWKGLLRAKMPLPKSSFALVVPVQSSLVKITEPQNPRTVGLDGTLKLIQFQPACQAGTPCQGQAAPSSRRSCSTASPVHNQRGASAWLGETHLLPAHSWHQG